MHEFHPTGTDDERRIVQRVLGHFDAPAFVRRVRRLEDSERILREHLAQKRAEWLAMTLRVGQLLALAGDWDRVRPHLASAESLDGIRMLHDALQPELRLPLKANPSARVLRAVLRELIAAIDLFNQRWQRYIAEFDLGPINALRDGYNLHYLIEKECALGNARVARMGFKRLDPLTTADLLREFPLLLVPSLAP
jgi:hypothetical protein